MTAMDELSVIKEPVFEYLDQLRVTGVTNMFGAAPYVQAEFDLEPAAARYLLSEWMRTFGERHHVS